jgi:CheY-like chemotaxis protein
LVGRVTRAGWKTGKPGRGRGCEPRVGGGPRGPGRVLVVDDNEAIRQLIKVNLELEGFEVVTADDGAECLEVVHRVRPDVITLDVVMPRLDGLRTATRLRNDPRTRHLPLAINSGCGRVRGQGAEGEPDDGATLARVAAAFLAKPFEPAALVRMVRRLADGVVSRR